MTDALTPAFPAFLLYKCEGGDNHAQNQKPYVGFYF